MPRQKKDTRELCYARYLMCAYMKILFFSHSPHFPNKFHCQLSIFRLSILHRFFRCFPLLFSRWLHNKFFVWKHFFFFPECRCSLSTPLQFSSLPQILTLSLLSQISLKALSFFSLAYILITKIFTSFWPSRACNAFYFFFGCATWATIILKIASFSFLAAWVD